MPVSGDFAGRKVIFYGTLQRISGNGACGAAHGPLRAVPCVISLLVGALYNIVDQIFIANASYLGSYDNALAGEEATDYLYEMGHRRIAYFGVSNAMLFSAERRRGYQMSLLKHGITPRESCCPPEV